MAKLPLYISNARLSLVSFKRATANSHIYKGVDGESNNPRRVFCFVKVLRKEHSRTEEEIYEIFKASDTPNVVQFIRACADESYRYVVLEYVSGKTLGDALRDKTFYRTNANLRSLFIQIIRGVEQCHHNGVFHREISCQSVLISPDTKRIFFADFGMATRQRYSKDQLRDSPRTAPDVYKAGPDDTYDSAAADVWSLGILMITIITDSVPWNVAQTRDHIFNQYIAGRDSFLQRNYPLLSNDFQQILMTALEIEPDDRIDLQGLRGSIEVLGNILKTKDLPKALHRPIELAKRLRSHCMRRNRPLPPEALAPPLKQDEEMT